MAKQQWRVIINHYDKGGPVHAVEMADVDQIVKWFPEISPSFFTNFEVEKMEFAFKRPNGQISIWTFHRMEI